MKKCSAVSPYTGLYMKYSFIVGVKNRAVFLLCDDLVTVKREWKYLRKKYRDANLYVHRIIVAADVDTQMRKRKELKV